VRDGALKLGYLTFYFHLERIGFNKGEKVLGLRIVSLWKKLLKKC